MAENRCPICLSKYVAPPKKYHHGQGLILSDCEACGEFKLEEEAWEDYLDPQTGTGSKLSDVDRARLSHHVRLVTTNSEEKYPIIKSDFVQNFIDDRCPGPNPIEQADNLVRYVGSQITETGNPMETLQEEAFAHIGAANPDAAVRLALELVESGIFTGRDVSHTQKVDVLNLNLTLSGWRLYQSIKSGIVHKNIGFIAMKFGDKILDPLIQNVIKPAIKSGIGYDLVDMRDVPRAGIIDNLMREQIRDSAFVIVDLTHDNLGAYWEAGYAEGLGKPVIYICEKSKFDGAKTHFDTNHCTTVLWSENVAESFIDELIATLRRSLNLFETAN